jgi:hypothetical protein
MGTTSDDATFQLCGLQLWIVISTVNIMTAPFAQL